MRKQTFIAAIVCSLTITDIISMHDTNCPALISAVQKLSYTEVQSLLAQQTNSCQQDSHGHTALDWLLWIENKTIEVAQKQHWEKELLQKRFDQIEKIRSLLQQYGSRCNKTICDH